MAEKCYDCGTSICSRCGQSVGIGSNCRHQRRYNDTNPAAVCYTCNRASHPARSRTRSRTYANTRGERPRIWWFGPLQKWAFRSPYLNNAKEMKVFLFFMKEQYDASWQDKHKVWLFPDSTLSNGKRYVDGVKELVRDYFSQEAEFVDKIEVPIQPVSSDRTDWLALFCSLTGASAPLERSTAKKAYILAVRKYHPDQGGDAAKMTDLNVAWQHIQGSLA